MKTILQLVVTMLAISLSLAGTLLDQIKQDPDLSQVGVNLKLILILEYLH